MLAVIVGLSPPIGAGNASCQFTRAVEINLLSSVATRKAAHPSTGSGRAAFLPPTQPVILPFALSSPRSGHVEGLLGAQLRINLAAELHKALESGDSAARREELVGQALVEFVQCVALRHLSGI